MKNATECKVCFSSDIVKVTTKDTKKRLAICRECGQVYELDANEKLVFHNDPSDSDYFKKLDETFGSWDNVESIAPYND